MATVKFLGENPLPAQFSSLFMFEGISFDCGHEVNTDRHFEARVDGSRAYACDKCGSKLVFPLLEGYGQKQAAPKKDDSRPFKTPNFGSYF